MPLKNLPQVLAVVEKLNLELLEVSGILKMKNISTNLSSII